MTSATIEQTDKELLKIFQRNRDPDAFAELVRRHHGMVYGVAKRMLGCSHAAEDVVQATFLVLAKDATKIRKRTSLASWLYGISFRISARFVQQRSKITAATLESEVMIDADPLERLSEQFEQNTVFEELHALPEKNRTPMVLRYLQGKSNAEVAEELNLSESAVEGRLKRGRNQLRLRLARQGVAFTVGVTLLGAIKQEASAGEMTRLVADTVEACSAGGAFTGSELISNEAIRLAEQEMMKMLATKMLNGVWVVAASLCVAAAGWGFAGNAIALAQGDDPFGAADPNGGDAIEIDEEDPFAPTNVGTSSSFASPPKSAASLDPFGAAPATPAASPDPFGNAPAKPVTLIERLQKLGQYGIGNETEAEVRILEALSNRRKASFQFEQVPLQDVAAVISEQHGIQIVFDRRALEDENIDPSSDPVTIDISNVRLQSAINLILDGLSLTTVVRDEVLMITTKSGAEGMLTTRLYKIPAHWIVTEDELVSSITALTVPDSWDSVGGPGTIKAVSGGVFVSNTHSVHVEVSKLFAQLDKLYEAAKSKRKASPNSGAF